MNNKKGLIGVFDSGFGGLTIFKEIVKILPKYDYIYLGDTARAPYGDRSQEVILKFTKQAVSFLFRQKCELIILACNTASSKALREIQQKYLPKYYPNKRVLGVIVPTAEIIATQNIKKVGVIGTKGTISSNVFKKEIEKLSPSAQVFQQQCPLLVPIIETGKQNNKIADIAIKDCLRPLLLKDIDALVLGCTHYELLNTKIKNIINKKIKIITQGRIVAGKLKDYLQRHPEIDRKLGKTSKKVFFTTDLTDRFQVLGSQFFGKKIKPEKTTLK